MVTFVWSHLVPLCCAACHCSEVCFLFSWTEKRLGSIRISGNNRCESSESPSMRRPGSRTSYAFSHLILRIFLLRKDLHCTSPLYGNGSERFSNLPEAHSSWGYNLISKHRTLAAKSRLFLSFCVSGVIVQRGRHFHRSVLWWLNEWPLCVKRRPWTISLPRMPLLCECLEWRLDLWMVWGPTLWDPATCHMLRGSPEFPLSTIMIILCEKCL